MAEQDLDQAFDHLHHVGLTFAQIGVFDLAELFDEVLHLLHQSPLGVAAPGLDQIASGVDQQGVGQHHQLQVDEGTHLAMGLARCGGRFQTE